LKLGLKIKIEKKAKITRPGFGRRKVLGRKRRRPCINLNG